jgi:hypothetical protein
LMPLGVTSQADYTARDEELDCCGRHHKGNTPQRKQRWRITLR